MLCTMDRIERSSPPGVLSSTTRACAWSARARSIAALRSRTVMGPMAPSISMIETGSAASAAEDRNRRTSRKVAGPTKRRRRVIATSTRMIARLRALFSQREDRDELEEQVGGEETRDLTGPVVGRRDLDHIGAHQVQATKRAHQ